jgi:hypothetical protein
MFTHLKTACAIEDELKEVSLTPKAKHKTK